MNETYSWSVLVVVVLAFTGMVQAGTAASTASDHVTNVSADDYSISELRTDGPQPAGAPASLRPYGYAGSYWIRHAPTGLGVDSSKSTHREYVKPDTVVKRSSVYLGSFRGWDSAPSDVTVRLVYWRVQEIEHYDDETGEYWTERRLVDVSSSRVNASLAGGTYDEVEIPLTKHYDDPVRVTMWIESDAGSLRWTFQHQASKAAESVPMESRSDVILWSLGMIFTPLSLVAIGFVAIDRRVLRKAVKGPGVSAGEYLFVGLCLAFFGLFVKYRSTMDVLAGHPYLIGVAGGLVVGLLVIELFGDETRDVLFLQFPPGDAHIRDDGSGRWNIRARIKEVARTESGDQAIVERGWGKFLARAWPGYNATSTLEIDGDPQTRFVGDQDGDLDEIYFVDPDTPDDPVSYTPESWSVDVPELLTWSDDSRTPAVNWSFLALLGITSTAGYLAGGHILGPDGAYFGGLLGVMVAVAKPNAGGAVVDLAPAQYTKVIQNLVKHSEEWKEAADREYFQDKYFAERASNRTAEVREREKSEETLFQKVTDELAPDDVPEGELAEVPGDD